MTEWLVEKHPSEQHTADRPTGVPTKEPLHASEHHFPALLAPATCQNVLVQIQACHEIAIPVILGSCVATRQGERGAVVSGIFGSQPVLPLLRRVTWDRGVHPPFLRV